MAHPTSSRIARGWGFLGVHRTRRFSIHRGRIFRLNLNRNKPTAATRPEIRSGQVLNLPWSGAVVLERI